MSLLDTGNESIAVYQQIESVDEYGTPVLVPSAEPVMVTGMAVQPVRADESAAEGSDTTTVYRVIGRTAPVGPYAAVEWGGRRWDVVGQPEFRRRTSAVRHVAFLIREVSGHGVGQPPTSSDGIAPT